MHIKPQEKTAEDGRSATSSVWGKPNVVTQGGKSRLKTGEGGPMWRFSECGETHRRRGARDRIESWSRKGIHL